MNCLICLNAALAANPEIEKFIILVLILNSLNAALAANPEIFEKKFVLSQGVESLNAALAANPEIVITVSSLSRKYFVSMQLSLLIRKSLLRPDLKCIMEASQCSSRC